MKNFVQPGVNVTVPGPSGGVLSGGPVLLNELFGVACGDAAENADCEIATEGVFDLAKTASVTPAIGEEAFYNSSTKAVTNASATGLFKIGVFTRAALAGDATCRVRLNGISVFAVPAP